MTIDATALALDRELSSEAVRLYYILADGKSLDDAAVIMGKHKRSLARYERQLRKAKYVELHHVHGSDGAVRREYVFLKRADRAQNLAS